AARGAKHSVYFNRGAVASQEYARCFLNIAPDHLEGPEQEAAYTWLSRGLLEALVAFIQRANGPRFGLYGAVYEFQWPAALQAIRAAADTGASGPRAKNESAIAVAHIEEVCLARTTGKIMHNKFFILTMDNQPIAVWTGSTNLTENGLF